MSPTTAQRGYYLGLRRRTADRLADPRNRVEATERLVLEAMVPATAPDDRTLVGWLIDSMKRSNLIAYGAHPINREAYLTLLDRHREEVLAYDR